MNPQNNRKRNVRVVFRLTEDEAEQISKKMEEANIRNREAYLRKMALDGYILRLDTEQVQRTSYLLSNIANNLNQIAKHANETRNIYGNDIQKLLEELPPAMQETKAAMIALAKI